MSALWALPDLEELTGDAELEAWARLPVITVWDVPVLPYHRDYNAYAGHMQSCEHCLAGRPGCPFVDDLFTFATIAREEQERTALLN